MAFYYLYEDFLRFLRAADQEDPWKAYRRCYFKPHRKFLLSYWRAFPEMDMVQLRDRVQKVRRGDYSLLEGLLANTDLKCVGPEILDRCMGVLPAPREPDVYFMVGFFSPEGFVLEFEDKPIMGFGLERFKGFRTLPIIFAHEYGHYLRRLWNGETCWGGEKPLGEVLLAEGLSVALSRLVFPERSLAEHLLLPRPRLNWCQQNEGWLRKLIAGKLGTSELVSGLFGSGCYQLGLPPRTGYYLGYRLVEDYLREHGRERLQYIIQAHNIAELGLRLF